jgi:hypothetical protein
MDRDIAIRMRLQAPIMRYADTTEHDMVALAKGVNIQALSDPVLHKGPL